MSEKKQRLAGKVAVITGAGRGIGRAEALLMAAQGAKVVVNDLGGGPTGGGGDGFIAQSVVDEIIANGGEAVAETSSVDSMAGGAAIVQAAIDAFGRIDILSNNAGILRPHRIDEMTEEDFDRVIAVNLKGYFAAIRHAAPHFIAQRSGIIINKGSPSGFGHYSMANYSAAKEGVAGLTRTVARDLGTFGVRTNLIRPVQYQSNMVVPEMGNIGKFSRENLGGVSIWNRPMTIGNSIRPAADHVAALTLWLSTDATSEVNGREFYISGAEVGLLPEPELQRATFEPAGWSIEAFEDPSNHQYLIGNVRNMFRPSN